MFVNLQFKCAANGELYEPMPENMSNIFSKIPFHAASLEIVEPMFEFDGVLIERIISTGQATPEGEWYDQKHHEWVILLTGHAGIQIEGELETRALRPGDYLFLPAHCRHRVEWTDERDRTIWLAVFFEPRHSETPNADG
ncbi:hypothetical protein MASR2M18_10680 [Ignavibacteria bacterium]|jgi:cupin 2 domain-containing protein